jgi:hypothetical protein
MNLQERDVENRISMELAEDDTQWQALVLTVLNL